MADARLEELRKAETNDIRIPRYDVAPDYVPTEIVNNQGEKINVFKHQTYGVEKSWFWQIYPPQAQPLASTPAALVGQTIGIQDAGPLMCQWAINKADLNIVEMHLEITGTYPSNDTTGIAYVPGILWIDRIEFSCDGAPYFQRLYSDVIFRLLLASLPPHKIHKYANQSGGWINGQGSPGWYLPLAAANLGTGAPTWIQTIGQGEGGITIFPYQLKSGIASLQAPTGRSLPDGRGKSFVIRFPLFGSFVQQAGFFQLEWIESGKLYISVYGSGRPTYWAASYNSSQQDVASLNLNMWFKCLSFKSGSASKEKLREVNETTRTKGLHIQYIDWLRTAFPLTGALTQDMKFQMKLNSISGRHVAFMYFIARRNSNSNSDSYWKLADNAGTPAVVPNVLVPMNIYDGPYYRTHLGIPTVSNGPFVDLLNATDQIILTNGQSTSIEQLQRMFWDDSKTGSNPHTLGLISGQDSYNPLCWSDLCFSFGDLLSSASGMYTGSYQFPNEYKVQVTPRVTPDSNIVRYDAYFASWRTLHIFSDGNSGTIAAEDDVPKFMKLRRR